MACICFISFWLFKYCVAMNLVLLPQFYYNWGLENGANVNQLRYTYMQHTYSKTHAIFSLITLRLLSERLLFVLASLFVAFWYDYSNNSVAEWTANSLFPMFHGLWHWYGCHYSLSAFVFLFRCSHFVLLVYTLYCTTYQFIIHDLLK